MEGFRFTVQCLPSVQPRHSEPLSAAMPHLTLERTGNLDDTVSFDNLFGRIHAVLAEAGIKKGNCKSRAIVQDHFYIGDGGAKAAFVHLDVRFLEGRSTEAKQEMGRRLLAILKECYADASQRHDLQITVEVRDIERAVYFKIPETSLDYGESE